MLLKQFKRPLQAARQAERTLPALVAAPTGQRRDYFSFMDRLRDKFHQPYRHVKAMFEPDGIHYDSQLPHTYNLHGNTAMTLNAYFGQNSIDLNQWHEMESVVHSQFGTVDNPVLIFTSDSSWRVVICQGPGVEDDSHQHEKMFYYVREGPIHRCHLCGQCFKIVRLKDEWTEEQDYYSLMFSQLSHFEVAEEDLMVNMTSLFGDRQQATLQQIPSTNVYIHVNADEHDRILVDPAYKMEKLKEAHEKLYAMHEAYKEVDKQLAKHRTYIPIPYGKDLYESWFGIEKAIRKFDRIFNKVEKFDGRKFADPANHERREKRMLDRKADRWSNHYTYFFGGLTEEEQMYRDYFETDLEVDPEDEHVEEFFDTQQILSSGEFDHKRYDFIETSLLQEPHENYEDLIEHKIFKYKYRQANFDPETFVRREQRKVDRFFERAKNRDPKIDANIFNLFREDSLQSSIGEFAIDPTKPDRYMISRETQPIRSYMLDEAIQ